MDALPCPALPLPCSSAVLQPHCVLLWCGTSSCSAQLKAPEDACSSTVPGLLRALSRVGPNADWSQSSRLVSGLLWAVGLPELWELEAEPQTQY